MHQTSEHLKLLLLQSQETEKVAKAETRLKTKQKVRLRSLVRTNCQTHYDTPPTLKPWYADVTVSADTSETPPVLCPGLLSAKSQLPSVLMTNGFSLTNKMDELEVFLRESS
ncbi:hypothetical protein QYM36_014805, partial [Artemia franciscana]